MNRCLSGSSSCGDIVLNQLVVASKLLGFRVEVAFGHGIAVSVEIDVLNLQGYGPIPGYC